VLSGSERERERRVGHSLGSKTSVGTGEAGDCRIVQQQRVGRLEPEELTVVAVPVGDDRPARRVGVGGEVLAENDKPGGIAA
jgi:hypothetical protein